MYLPILFGISIVTGSAQADGTPKIIRYDSYADEGPDGFTFGAYFQEEGLGKFNCMAQVYSFEDADFPLVPTQLRMFFAGEGAGAASEVELKIYFYHYEGQAADEWTMAADQYRVLDQEVVLLEGISLEGTWVELNLAENGFDFDGDPDVEGKQPITYGSVVASVCYENVQTMPAIAFDNDGYTVEPVPEDDEDIVSGHETSQFRSLIYWNGLWANLANYLLYTFDFPDGGDLIMRLVVEAHEDNDDDVIDGLYLSSVSPDRQAVGDSEALIITGVGIDRNAEAFVGGQPLTAVSVQDSSVTDGNGEAMSGQVLTGHTSADLSIGSHNVMVRNPDGESHILEGAFRVTARGDSGGADWLDGGTAGSGASGDDWGDDDDDGAKSGCSNSPRTTHGMAWIWVLLPLLISRRSDSAQG